MNTIGWLETLGRDARFALRGFRNSPGFTAVALLSLMLGIGATTAIFSVIYGVLIDPYPYARPGRNLGAAHSRVENRRRPAVQLLPARRNPRTRQAAPCSPT